MRAFVLSGGGSRGALQVGVSAGAVNAALLASDPILAGVQAMKLFWLDDLPKHPPSLHRGEAILWSALMANEQFTEVPVDIVNCAELDVFEVGPAIGTHAGPSTLGVAFYTLTG